MTRASAFRHNAAGWLLFLTIFASLASAFSSHVSSLVPGIMIWVTSFLLIPDLKKAQRWQIGVLMGVGVLGLTVGELRSANSEFLWRAAGANEVITAMLLAVSFLRIISALPEGVDKPLPVGKNALLKTLFGVHLLGTVMNVSAVMIAGDRLTEKRPLKPLQALTLLRGFSACAVWSPFFASMGITLVGVPDARLGTLILFGFPAAMIMLAIAAWQISRDPDADSCAGFPVTFNELWLPVTLAVFVMGTHFIWPDISVLSFVTFWGLLFALIVSLIKFKGQTGEKLVNHIHNGLPRMAGEVFLFLAAAVLASGAASALESFGLKLVPDHFGFIASCATVAILLVLAIVGMHPVTTVALAAGILAPHVENATLLGMTLLFGWNIGVCFSPFSGVQLTLQSRFGIRARDLATMNLKTALPLVLLAMATLYICSIVTQ